MQKPVGGCFRMLVSAPRITWSPREAQQPQASAALGTPAPSSTSRLWPGWLSCLLPLLATEWPVTLQVTGGRCGAAWHATRASPRGVRHGALRSSGTDDRPPHPVLRPHRAPPSRLPLPDTPGQGPGTQCLCRGLLGSGRLSPDGTRTAKVGFERPLPVTLRHPRTEHPRPPLLWRRQVQSSKAPRLTSTETQHPRGQQEHREGATPTPVEQSRPLPIGGGTCGGRRTALPQGPGCGALPKRGGDDETAFVNARTCR